MPDDLSKQESTRDWKIWSRRREVGCLSRSGWKKKYVRGWTSAAAGHALPAETLRLMAKHCAVLQLCNTYCAGLTNLRLRLFAANQTDIPNKIQTYKHCTNEIIVVHCCAHSGPPVNSGPVEYSTSTVHYSTVQYTTAQYSTSTVPVQ